MPKIDISKAKVRTGTNYPPQFQNVVEGREKSALAIWSASPVRSQSDPPQTRRGVALRHWHENEDEFVYVLEGELVLIEDGGETC